MPSTPWFKAQLDLPDHPKTLISSYHLRIKADTLVGKLHRLWGWALLRHPDGFIPYYEASSVADATAWKKSPKRLMDALCLVPHGYEHGFLVADPSGAGWHINDWEEHTGAYYRSQNVKTQDKRRKRIKNARVFAEIPAEIPHQNASNPPEILPENTPKTAPIDNRYIDTDKGDTREVDTKKKGSSYDAGNARARAKSSPLYYNDAYKTSPKARAQVAQNLLNAYPCLHGPENHAWICDLIADGVSPDDIASEAGKCPDEESGNFMLFELSRRGDRAKKARPIA